jgi:hypothetical protein
LGSALKITVDLLPEKYELYQNCLRMTGGNIHGDLYVQQHSDYNAYVHAVSNRFDIVVSSAIFKDFRQQEIAFVIGHELGHVLFEHNKIPTQRILSNPQGVPYDFAQLLFHWSRAAEISADRVGLLCSGSLGSAACTFFKLSSGLLLDKEDVVINALRKQFDEVQKLAGVRRLSNEWATTHPLIPIRFHSLELIALDILSLRNGISNKVSWHGIDQEIENALIESEPLHDTSFLSTREGVSLLMLCLLYVAASDRPINGIEEQFIRDTQRRLAPSIHIDDVMNTARYDTRSFSQGALQEVSRMDVAEADAVRVLELCHYLAIADSLLEPREAQAMQEICRAMKCDPWLVEQVINEHDVLE